MTRFVMTTDRAVTLAIGAAGRARGGEVFVFKMPVVRLGDLVDATIDVIAPAAGHAPGSIGTTAIEPRAGEKPYEELMTAEESTRARDIGEMYAVLPAIEAHADVIEEYRDRPASPVGAYRSDAVEPISPDEARALVLEAFAAEPIGAASG